MTSSMLNGERRWAPGRRSGMTVLGKVAVPKPINLPSQRLENHGVDPNVEIVPKGTHSWGSRSSSSASNAWGSCSLSLNDDGGTGSPSHLSGRPSSGGSGTRPSTASSEKAREPIVSAWGTNSRPSSSSGALPSNQTSHAALRPRSAETRPGSSQLSRFAEHLSDNSVAWHAMGTADKLGVTSSKNDGFSLTSGDFPSLGSEKDNSGKNLDSQDHDSFGRPGSSSAGVASRKEGTEDSGGDVSAHANVKSGAEGPWRRENVCGEDGARPSVEKWNADFQPYPNSSIPPQHYDAWRGPPVNNHPGAVWGRGPPGCPPFRSPVAPGGFPMEPFPYYHPQIPPPALANPQAVPPPGAGPRGPHPKNGDLYRPHMHDAYMHPNMPLRPSFYPGPVPYEGYYGPPIPYCNPNERDLPFMGMAMGPATYNRYHGQSIPDPGNSHGRTSGYGPSSKAMILDQVEPVHPQDSQQPYKVLLKQQDCWEGKDEEQKFDDAMKTIASYPLKGEHTRKSSSGENGWRADSKKDHEFDTRRMAFAEESSSGAVDNQRFVPTKVKSSESGLKMNTSDVSSVKKFEHAPSNFPQESADPKDSSLIQKIEGLNAKTRASDGRQDTKPFSSEEEQNSKLQAGNAVAGHFTNETGIDSNEMGIDSLSHEETCVSGVINSAPHEDCFSAGDRNLESTIVSGTTIPRRCTHGMHSRADHRSKGRFSPQEDDVWRKKSQVADPQCLVSTAHYEISSVHGQDHSSAEAPQNSVLHPSLRDEGESMPPASEPSDSQRAKMRELAKRIKQREKEEEERTREQRAKALAKLEELNRRTQAGEVGTQKLENVPACAIQNRQEESLNLSQPTMDASKSGAPSSSFGSKTKTVAQSRQKLETLPSSVVQNRHEKATTAVVSCKSIQSRSALGSNLNMVGNSEINMNAVEKSVSITSNVPVETPKVVNNESVVVHEQLNPLQPDSNSADATWKDSSAKQKRTGFRQKQNSPLERNSNEKLGSSFGTEASKSHADIAANATISPQDVADEIDSNCESNLPTVAAESSVHNRRKNKNGKNKHSVEEALPAAALPLVVAKDATTSEPKSSNSLLDPSSGHFPTDSKDANHSSERHLWLTNEETNIRVNNQWRSQHPRRMMKNPQGNKSTEKSHSGDAVVWAPVRSQHRTEVSDTANQNSLVESVLSIKNVQQVQNNPRNKRAEMERYIPKHVAKELSQQGSSHQAAILSCNQITSDETAERHKSGSLGVESSLISGTATAMFSPAMASRNGDVRHNKSGKRHGAWHQHGAAESTTSNPRSISQNSVEDDQCHKADVSSVNEQPRDSDDWNASDGWNMPENSDTACTIPCVKDQGVTARVKQQPHKGHKGTGYHHNPDKMYIQSVAPERHQRESLLSSKENNSAGERSTTHWQPKSQPISATSHRGRQTNSSMNEGSDDGRAIKESTLHGGPLLPQPDGDTAAVGPQSHSYHDQSPSKKNLEEAPTIGQEPKGERKMTAQRGRPGSPFESSSPNLDVRYEKRMSSGFHKNGNQYSRFSRNHNSPGDKSGSRKDSKQHNVPAVREGQKHNSHYEYQPVGPHNNNKANNLEPSKDISLGYSGTGYRERGQSHSRRDAGNFYGRRTGNVQVDAGHD